MGCSVLPIVAHGSYELRPSCLKLLRVTTELPSIAKNFPDISFCCTKLLEVATELLIVAKSYHQVCLEFLRVATELSTESYYH